MIITDAGFKTALDGKVHVQVYICTGVFGSRSVASSIPFSVVSLLELY